LLFFDGEVFPANECADVPFDADEFVNARRREIEIVMERAAMLPQFPSRFSDFVVGARA